VGANGSCKAAPAPPDRVRAIRKSKGGPRAQNGGQRIFWKTLFPLALLGLTPSVGLGVRDFRFWTLEQLAQATTYLLGPNESMLAGEVSMHALWDSWTRDLAVAVTAAHVLVFRIDSVDGQPRWIALAARLTDVKLELRTGVFGRLWPALEVRGRSGRWTINGFHGEFNPELVVDAWWQGAKGTANTS
jgi:hypothetical protein